MAVFFGCLLLLVCLLLLQCGRFGRRCRMIEIARLTVLGILGFIVGQMIRGASNHE